MQSGGPPSGKRYRFNAPPGWPVYPQEWVPPPGWQPDPSWPPAPPGWPFWSEVAPPEAKPKRRMVRAIQIGAAVITFIATVVGLGIAIEGRPKPVRLADWSSKANAACEKYFGDILTPVLAVTPQLAQEIAAMQAGDSDNERVADIAKQLSGIAGAFSKLAGELDGLQPPKGETRVPDLITAGRDISTGFAALASVFTEWAMGQTTPDNLASGAQAMQRLFGTSMPQWSRLSGDLKLDQCARFAPDSAAPASPVAPPPGPTTAPPAQLTGAEAALVALIKAAVLVDCVPSPATETGDIVAAVNCQAAQQGPTKLPLVMQFATVDAMNQWIDRYASGITPVAGTRCPDGAFNDQWTGAATNNARAGQLLCHPVSAGDFSIVWSFDAAAVVAIVDGADGPSLYQWWTANAYLITSP